MAKDKNNKNTTVGEEVQSATEAAAVSEEAKNDAVEDKAGVESEESAPDVTTAEAENEKLAGVDTGEEPVDTTEEGPGLEKQLEQALQEAASHKENWLRAVAELANFKRRQEEQLKLQKDMIKGELLRGVISALDDMDLAFQNVPEEIDGQLIGWVEGFRLVQRKLDKVLEEQSVVSIDTDGDFDPNLHEAISYEESEDHQEGQIIAEMRKGYRSGNRVIRPALVRVAKATNRTEDGSQP